MKNLFVVSAVMFGFIQVIDAAPSEAEAGTRMSAGLCSPWDVSCAYRPLTSTST